MSSVVGWRSKRRIGNGERERVRNLHRMARNWRLAEDIRQFLRAAEASVPESSRTESFEEWFGWARGHAEELDPLVRIQAMTIA
jgi:hypothetical protein